MKNCFFATLTYIFFFIDYLYTIIHMAIRYNQYEYNTEQHSNIFCQNNFFFY